MPELPEVETSKRGISPHICGQTVCQVILRRKTLRWPIPMQIVEAMEGEKLEAISRRGKYLLFELQNGTAIWHLGMSGSLRILKNAEPPAKHDHVDIVFSNGCVLRYNDPRRFGALLWTTEQALEHPLLVKLGPEPLLADFNSDYLYARSRKRTQAIKTWIMNSAVVVGVGNIYANEALFSAGIHPLKPAHKLTREKAVVLTANIKDILIAAIARGGTTLRDFVGGDGKPGYFAQELNVYGRGGEPCKGCGKKLTEKKLGQRATVYCTVCQT